MQRVQSKRIHLTPVACAVQALERFISLSDIKYLVISHLSPKRVPSFKAFLQKRKGGSELQVALSNPAMQVLKSNMGEPVAWAVVCNWNDCPM